MDSKCFSQLQTECSFMMQTVARWSSRSEVTETQSTASHTKRMARSLQLVVLTIALLSGTVSVKDSLSITTTIRFSVSLSTLSFKTWQVAQPSTLVFGKQIRLMSTSRRHQLNAAVVTGHLMVKSSQSVWLTELSLWRTRLVSSFSL